MSYHDTNLGQEVGLWHREKLVRLCISSDETFFLADHTEYEFFPEENHDHINLYSDDCKMHSILTKENNVYAFLPQSFKKHVFSDEAALPNGIETYSKDFRNLPLTYRLKEELNGAFFGEYYDELKNDENSFIVATNNSSLSKDIQKHVSAQ